MDTDIKKLDSSKPPGLKVERDSDLIGMLSKQLYLAGDQLQRMKIVLKKTEDRLKSKDQEFNRLKRKLKDWESKEKSQESNLKKESKHRKTQFERSDYIYKRCLKLEKKIDEIEKFLSNYGLIWVGEKKSASKNFSQITPDYLDKIILNIEDLNMSVGKGEMFICRNSGGASFKLRPYDDPSSQAFLKDIFDGFFPSELQCDYPNGVPFKVEDYRTKHYLGSGANYPGSGHQLGNISTASSKIYSINSSVEEKHSVSAKSSDLKHPYNLSIKSPRFSSRTKLSNPSLFNLQIPISITQRNNSEKNTPSNNNVEITSGNIKNNTANLSSRIKISNYTQDVSKRSSHSSKHKFELSDRSSLDLSARSNFGIRPRSVSFSRDSFRFSHSSMPSSTGGNSSSSRSCKDINGSNYSKLRTSKSTTMTTHNYEMPLVQEINESTKDSGELRLKIRSLNGRIVYLAYVFADDSVNYLYHLLDRAMSRKRKRTPSYKIVISGFTSRRLDHMDISLKNYGIDKDTVLHLVND
ncbi:Similar to Ubxn11: UBX domain-containing protein 11 (Rattus norvegicus) [Cotesia congregata]|uniref:Similar to Ubxn11: UBX domain-containing protein 11 (Rattus norvegicus) n=1 Tax=Cotesia congregata TaxID=51543 RepID=A0A8J2MZP3_COTCN|nr:Similar to Ubxn11: UBX domain-containing protein 11 (Rattus norvegicus) [Cotesia congregata]